LCYLLSCNLAWNETPRPQRLCSCTSQFIGRYWGASFGFIPIFDIFPRDLARKHTASVILAFRKPRPCPGGSLHANEVTLLLGGGRLFFWTASGSGPSGTVSFISSPRIGRLTDRNTNRSGLYKESSYCRMPHARVTMEVMVTVQSGTPLDW
jgi:hypothetical protein